MERYKILLMKLQDGAERKARERRKEGRKEAEKCERRRWQEDWSRRVQATGFVGPRGVSGER